VSFTYNITWVGSRDYIRFQLQDTTAPGQFQDEELDALLAQWGGDARMAAADALEALAGRLSRSAIKYWVTGFGLDRTQQGLALLKAAQRLREEARSIPFEFESLVDHHVTRLGEDWSNYPDTEETGV